MRLHHGLLSWRTTVSNVFITPCRRTQLGRRTIFGIPDLSSLSPLASSGSGVGGGSDGEQTYHERKILPYTQKQLYELVADVDNYHHFVPYCTESKVLSSRIIEAEESAGRKEKKEARLTVGFLAFKESYVSEVTCQPYLYVEAIASSGTPLFKKLITTWRFQPAHSSSPHSTRSGVVPSTSSSPDVGGSQSTLLSIDLVFAFSNPLYAAASTTFFKQISAMMVEAFERRCVEVYGQGRR